MDSGQENSVSHSGLEKKVFSLHNPLSILVCFYFFFTRKRAEFLSQVSMESSSGSGESRTDRKTMC